MVVFIVLFLATCTAWCNDSEFFGSGSSLMPMKNAHVRMVREDLTIGFSGDSAVIDVEYVFRNKGKSVTLTVGFVSPPPSAEDGIGMDEGSPDPPNPPIAWITTTVNGKSIPTRPRRVKTLPGGPTEHVYEDDWVFLSKITFRSGLTRVRHSYRFAKGGSVWALAHIPYRLTTGTHWQGGVIDTFRLVINVDDRSLVSVPTSFTEDTGVKLPWRTTGQATILDSAGYVNNYDDVQIDRRIVYAIENGQIVLEQLTFCPTRDLEVTILDARSLVDRIIGSTDRSWVRQLSCIELEHIGLWYEQNGLERQAEIDHEVVALVRSISAERCH